ncbi:MAG: hypothetical protein WB676_23240 [Bryobacteraceae bacterium]
MNVRLCLWWTTTNPFFITAMRDDAVRARVVELGAAACLTRPFSDTALLEALRSVMTPN